MTSRQSIADLCMQYVTYVLRLSTVFDKDFLGAFNRRALVDSVPKPVGFSIFATCNQHAWHVECLCVLQSQRAFGYWLRCPGIECQSINPCHSMLVA